MELTKNELVDACISQYEFLSGLTKSELEHISETRELAEALQGTELKFLASQFADNRETICMEKLSLYNDFLVKLKYIKGATP